MHGASDSSTAFFKESIFFTIIASLLLASCGAPAPEKRTLRVWDFRYGEAAMGDALRAVDREFERLHPGTAVEHRGLPELDYDQVLTTALAAGAGPDLAMVHAGAQLRSLEDRFAPADAAAAGLGVLPSALDACRDAKGTLRAIPVTVQGFGWYYNKKLFAKAGLDASRPPAGWDAFLAACGKLKAAGIRPIAWGNSPAHGSDWLRRTLAATYYQRDELADLFRSGRFVEDARFRIIEKRIRELRDRGCLDAQGAFRDQIRDASADFRAGGAGFYLGLLSDIDNWKDFSDALGPGALGFFPSLACPDAKYPGRLCLQDAGIAWAAAEDGPRRELALEYAAFYLKPFAAAILADRVGALLPLAPNAGGDAGKQVGGQVSMPGGDAGAGAGGQVSPAFEGALRRALGNAGADAELFYPDKSVKEAFFRYDELYYSTREISEASYLAALAAAVSGKAVR